MIPYRQANGIAQSDLKLFAASPLLYYQTKILGSVQPKPPSDEMIFGTQCEAFIRSRGSEVEAKIIPDSSLLNGARRGNVWKEFKESNPDHESWQTRREWDESTERLRCILQSVEASELASQLLLGPGNWSVPMFWRCPTTGLPRKAELDRLIRDDDNSVIIVVDFKTCRDSSPRAWCKAVHEFGYVVQASTYLEAVEETILRPDRVDAEVEFLFVAVRSCPPYDIWVYSVPDELLAEGHLWNAEHMAELSRRYDTNDWEPACEYAGNMYRPSKIGDIVLPKWSTSIYETSVEIIG